MNQHAGSLFVWVAIYSTSLTAPTIVTAGDAKLGVNLSGPADWNTEQPFADVFRLSRPWISQKKGTGWGSGPKLDLDEHGWVKKLAPDSWAETPLCTIEGGNYPSGEYTVLYEGRGRLDVWGAAKMTDSQPGKMTIEVDARRGGFFLKLLEVDLEDPVRQIRVLAPQVKEDRLKENPWSDSFLARWKGVASFRFMDFQETNNSKQTHWADRPKPTDATFSGKGVPIELMVDLANRQEADPWFCMPHLADDEYIRSFAKLVKARLDPRRKVYVEYSNEVWNGQFEQHAEAARRGVKLGFAPSKEPWVAAWRYTAHRSKEIFAIWEKAFGGKERLIRVLPTQSANPYVSEQILAFEDAYQSADALAVAPYFGPAFGPQTQPSAEVAAKWTPEQLFDHIEKTTLPEAAEMIRKQKKVADQNKLKLIAYEGGQHLVGIAGGENNERLTELLTKANRHPRMGKVYDAYLKSWETGGGEMFCHFSSVSASSKWGHWGLLEYSTSNVQEAPKFLSVMRWAKQLDQPVAIPD